MSTALVKKAPCFNNATPAQQPATDDSGRHGHVTTPRMRAEYQAVQLAQGLWSLPDELKLSILTHSGKAVFNLGLTCKYWNLRTREFLTEDPEGRHVLRQKYEEAFRSTHRMSVINAVRATLSTSFQKFFEFDDSYWGKECQRELKTSKEPVYLVPPCEGKWITTDFKLALASRSCKLTIFEIDAPDGDSMSSIITAIKAIPLNGFAALSISSTTLSLPNVADLWDAISSHPVVAFIECKGNNELATGGQVVEWMTLLSKKNMNVSAFELNNCRLDEQSRDALSALLTAQTGIDELEVCERETSAENTGNLFDAVRARNAGGHPKLTLYFTAANLADLIDARERSTLVVDGIYIRDPGDRWVIQEDPVENELARKDSSDDDSSSVVGDPSSGDDDFGSEFDSSDENSDVIVQSSSDSEG